MHYTYSYHIIRFTFRKIIILQSDFFWEDFLYGCDIFDDNLIVVLCDKTYVIINIENIFDENVMEFMSKVHNYYEIIFFDVDKCNYHYYQFIDNYFIFVHSDNFKIFYDRRKNRNNKPNYIDCFFNYQLSVILLILCLL